MGNESLYFVFNPMGNAPKARHECLSDARAEAERLAELLPDKEFFVCRVVESIKYNTSPYIRKVYAKKG